MRSNPESGRSEVNEGERAWIDPAAARQLMLEYRETLRVKGGSEIERKISRYANLGISRKTLENWLNDTDSVPSPQTLKIVSKFLRTAHFAEMVPRVRDYLESDARLCRIGSMLFDLYGVKGEDTPVSIAKNTYLAGWWKAEKFFNSNTASPSYLQIVPVADHPFSKIHILVRSIEVPAGSGIAFPITTSSYLDFSVRVWSQGGRHREKSLKIYCMPRGDKVLGEQMKLLFEKTENPPYAGLNSQSVAFNRVDETDVPTSIRALFIRWNQSILPARLSEWGLIG